MTRHIFQTAEIRCSSEAFQVVALPYKLSFRYPFRLAHGVRSSTDIVILRIQSASVSAYGEAALPPYLGIAPGDVLQFFKALPWSELITSDLPKALTLLDSMHPAMAAAKAAVDIALHDWHGHHQQLAIARMYQLPSKPVPTTITIGLSSEAELLQKLDAAAPFHMIKLKLGGPDDRLAIDTFLKHCTKAFCVDVNQGWHDRDAAARLIDYLAAKGVTFIEQPMPVGREDDMAWLRSRTGVPIIADESVQRLADLQMASQVFDGVNIKLMKCTGIAEAHRMVLLSRELGLRVVLGAMAESSCGATAAAHLASLADWVDLDGPLLIDNDPFRGIGYKHGNIMLPDGHGIGLRLRFKKSW